MTACCEAAAHARRALRSPGVKWPTGHRQLAASWPGLLREGLGMKVTILERSPVTETG